MIKMKKIIIMLMVLLALLTNLDLAFADVSNFQVVKNFPEHIYGGESISSVYSFDVSENINISFGSYILSDFKFTSNGSEIINFSISINNSVISCTHNVYDYSYNITCSDTLSKGKYFAEYNLSFATNIQPDNYNVSFWLLPLDEYTSNQAITISQIIRNDNLLGGGCIVGYTISSPVSVDGTAGSSVTVPVTVTYTGTCSGSVTVTASVPTGWTATSATTNLLGAANPSQTVNIIMTIPADATTSAIAFSGAVSGQTYTSATTVNIPAAAVPPATEQPLQPTTPTTPTGQAVANATTPTGQAVASQETTIGIIIVAAIIVVAIVYTALRRQRKKKKI